MKFFWAISALRKPLLAIYNSSARADNCPLFFEIYSSFWAIGAPSKTLLAIYNSSARADNCPLFFEIYSTFWAIGAVGSAPERHSGGHKFEPCIAHLLINNRAFSGSFLILLKQKMSLQNLEAHLY